MEFDEDYVCSWFKWEDDSIETAFSDRPIASAFGMNAGVAGINRVRRFYFLALCLLIRSWWVS